MGDTQMKTGRLTTTQQLTITAIFIALTFLATWLIKAQIPFFAAKGGLVHLGNVPLFVAAMVYGRKTGAIAGAFGMALFDLMGGWFLWAPFTFVVVGLMGYTVGLICEKSHLNPNLTNIIAVSVALVLKIIGYYIAEGVIYGNWISPVASIPGNIVQIVTAAVIVLPTIERIKTMAKM
ncbi:MAG: ECF transporter S component [Eubacteriales bacterium]